jgi:hypothetical protein
MKFVSIILLVFTAFNVNSQVSPCNDIIGKWTVKKATLMEIEDMQLGKKEKAMLDSMKNGFINSVFIFNADKTFLFKLDKNVPQFMNELLFINNKMWKCNPDKGSILIGTNEDNFSLMEIEKQVQAEETIFIIVEAPFILNVIKN